ncbi:hypothetical protein [Alteribacillus sp. YIM 98480]|uniref:hypothetical protein n=1 Tax=Alteribacillus sp. YIM 98480 TaxID=2606599 RepID=UPI00131B94F5|nr:hypothetical protein [Alteribacillus sp. YIM 98480]
MSFTLLGIKPLNDEFEDPIYPVKINIVINDIYYEERVVYNRIEGLGKVDWKSLNTIMHKIPKSYQNKLRKDIVESIFE